MSALTDIRDYIAHRREIYRTALNADLARLRALHGPHIVAEAERLADAQEAAERHGSRTQLENCRHNLR